VDVKESNLGADRLMPSMGSEVFRQLCRKISSFSECVQKAKRQCPNHITVMLINASYGYLCRDGYDVFLKSADCLMKLDQEESVRFCHDRTMNAIKNSSNDAKSTMPQKLVRMCESLNYFASCVEQPVLRECGMPAWGVIARVLHDTTKTLMPSCKFAVPVPGLTTLAADSVISEKNVQLNQGGKSAGRQKVSAVGTMTTDSAVVQRAKNKNKGKNNNMGDSSHFNSNADRIERVGIISFQLISVALMVLLRMVLW